MNSAANCEMMTNFSLMEKIGRAESLTETDKSTLKTIFNLYHRQVFRLCVQVTRNLKIAENITVSVFAEAYRELHESNYNVVLTVYLRRLTVSKLLEYRRENQK